MNAEQAAESLASLKEWIEFQPYDQHEMCLILIDFLAHHVAEQSPTPQGINGRVSSLAKMLLCRSEYHYDCKIDSRMHK